MTWLDTVLMAIALRLIDLGTRYQGFCLVSGMTLKQLGNVRGARKRLGQG